MVLWVFQGDFYLSTMKPCCQDASFTDDGPFTLYSQLGNMFNIFFKPYNTQYVISGPL